MVSLFWINWFFVSDLWRRAGGGCQTGPGQRNRPPDRRRVWNHKLSLQRSSVRIQPDQQLHGPAHTQNSSVTGQDPAGLVQFHVLPKRAVLYPESHRSVLSPSQEAQNLMALTNVDTPLKGGLNTPCMRATSLVSHHRDRWSRRPTRCCLHPSGTHHASKYALLHE